MKGYKDFSAVDFAQDEKFLLWVRYPERDPELKEFWSSFLMNHPEKLAEINEARDLILAVVNEPTHAATAEEGQQLFNRIKQSIAENDDDATTNVSAQSFSWFKIAAVLTACIAVAAGYFFVHNWSKPEHMFSHDKKFIKEINNGDKARQIILVDGTSITLQPKSVLYYPETFDNNVRDVKLEGEAFFNVMKDANRPFMVYAEQLVTKVLGTSFTIRAFDDENTLLVQVKTGKVSVFSEEDLQTNQAKLDNQLSGIILTPNQQVVFSKEDSRMTRSLVDNPTIISPDLNKSFTFSDAPLTKVFEQLETAYGIDIVYDEELMGRCLLNASLDSLSLYDKMRLICKGFNADYQILDSRIVVSGKGCDE
jgi:ferric-dicitrate binding protein FerR (iron transport regulator)